MADDKSLSLVPLKTIEGVSSEFEDAFSLKDLCVKKDATIERLVRENSFLKSKVRLLEQSARAATQEVVKIEVSKEQAICEIQIQKLQERAALREMTLEETKRLEILVKSLYLIKEKTGSTASAEYSVLPADATIAQLSSIASSPEFTEIE